MYLPELALSAVRMVREREDKPGFDPRGELTSVLNPPDGPCRLVGLPYTDAMTEEALEAGVRLVSSLPGDEKHRSAGFWLLVAFACSYASQLPLQVADVDAAGAFLQMG